MFGRMSHLLECGPSTGECIRRYKSHYEIILCDSLDRCGQADYLMLFHW